MSTHIIGFDLLRGLITWKYVVLTDNCAGVNCMIVRTLIRSYMYVMCLLFLRAEQSLIAFCICETKTSVHNIHKLLYESSELNVQSSYGSY